MNIFVTGGSRGIGRAIVLKLVKEGHSCAFTYSSNKTEADKTIEMIKQISSKSVVKSYKMDVRKSDEVEKTVESVINDFNDIQGIVNNAAIVRNNAAVMMSNEEWDDVIAADLSGPFYVIRSFLMHFISNRYGKIINISSLAQDGCSGQTNYSAAKAGLVGMTKTLAKEYGPKGICSNVVTVGYVQTDMTDNHMADDLHKFWLQYCPLKRIGSADDIAHMVHFLLSKESDFVNGEVIRVSGGLTYAP